MKSRTSILFVIAINACTAVASNCLAQEMPPPGSVTISGFNYSGNGCLPNSSVINISEDAQAFTILFDSYTVDTSNPAARVMAGRTVDARNCMLTMQLNAPAGWSFALLGLSVRGYALLDQQSAGRQAIAFRTPGIGVERQFDNIDIPGPYNGDFIKQALFPLNALQWSVCSGQSLPLFIRTALQASSAQGGRAYMAVDSIDGEVEQTYGIAWRRCTDDPSSLATIQRLNGQLNRFFTHTGRHGRRSGDRRPPPRPTVVPTPMVPSNPAMRQPTNSCITNYGPQIYQGMKWYLSWINQSCDELCATRGGVDSPATINFVGSGAPDASGCRAVIARFGCPTQGDVGGGGQAVGCFINGDNLANLGFRSTNPPTTTDFRSVYHARVCACNR